MTIQSKIPEEPKTEEFNKNLAPPPQQNAGSEPPTGHQSNQSSAETKHARMARIFRWAALVSAIVAGVSTAWGQHISSPTGAVFIPIITGSAIAILLAVGWHYTLSAAEDARTKQGIITVVCAALILASVAVATSARSMTAAIAGSTVTAVHQQEALSEHEAALKGAVNNVLVQDGIAENAAIAASTFATLRREEGRRGGCGPKCNSYGRVAEGFNSVATNIARAKQGLASQQDQATRLLNDARQHIAEGNHEAFAEDLGKVAAIISVLDGTEYSRMLQGDSGLISTGESLPGMNQVGGIVQGLRDQAAKARLDMVEIEVPSYVPLSPSEGVVEYAHRVLGEWSIAIGIDIFPALLAILIMALVPEPLLRTEAKRGPTRPEDAKRIRSDEVAISRDDAA